MEGGGRQVGVDVVCGRVEAAQPLLLASRPGRLGRGGWRWFDWGGCCRGARRHSRFCWLGEAAEPLLLASGGGW